MWKSKCQSIFHLVHFSRIVCSVHVHWWVPTYLRTQISQKNNMSSLFVTCPCEKSTSGHVFFACGSYKWLHSKLKCLKSIGKHLADIQYYMIGFHFLYWQILFEQNLITWGMFYIIILQYLRATLNGFLVLIYIWVIQYIF